MKLHRPTFHSLLRRRRELAVVAVVAALATAVPSVAAQASTSPRAETSGGVVQHYLATHHSHFATVFGGKEYADYGLTLDGVIAMDSAGVGDYRSEKATEYVAKHIDAYIGSGTTQYAGATAKALLVAMSQRVTPKGNLGGVNLVFRLRSLEVTSGPARGRFSDTSSSDCQGKPVPAGTGCDFSNTFGQSYALVGLKRAGKSPSDQARRYLNLQQCPNGGFRIQLGDKRCTSNKQADTDATSLAVQGLLAEPGTHARSERISKAIGYLKTRMTSSGGVKGGAPTNTPNANSTGLAVMGFDSAGYQTLGSKGRHYLVTMRFGCAYPASMRGAVAYDATRKKQASSEGRKAKLIDQDLRSTAQAVLGFSGTSLLEISNKGAKQGSPRVSC